VKKTLVNTTAHAILDLYSKWWALSLVEKKHLFYNFII